MKNLTTCAVFVLLAVQTAQAQSNKKTTQSNQTELRQPVWPDSIRQSADTMEMRQPTNSANRLNIGIRDSTRSTGSDSIRNTMLADSNNAMQPKSAGTIENTAQSQPDSTQTSQKISRDTSAATRQNMPIKDGVPAQPNVLQQQESVQKPNRNNTQDILSTQESNSKPTAKPLQNKKEKHPKN